MLRLMAAAPGHVRIAVKDKAKVNTGSSQQQLRVHRARGWGQVAPQEGFAKRRGECNIMTL